MTDLWIMAALALMAVGTLGYVVWQRQWYRALYRAQGRRHESKMAEARLQAAELVQTQKLEALGQLAGGVAHDFNNVLAIIDGYVHMALKALPEDNERLATYLNRIDVASKRGAALTQQLLIFGRKKADADDIIDIATIIDEQESLLYPLLNSSVSLEVRTCGSLLVQCAPDAISQIVMNLVINARDAMPDGGRITIEARACAAEDMPGANAESQAADFALISIADTGVGMDEATVARIFDPFFTTKDQGLGTGLGLSMVYGMVQDMQGFIDVHTVPGQGTAMRIFLPRSQCPASSAVQTGNINDTFCFDGYTALVVEDEPDFLGLVTAMLEERGMEVIPAANGAEALARQDAFEGDIDFLITDVAMPGLNGVKLAELVQAAREETDVVFMSGFPASGRLSRIAIPEGAVLLAKPVAFEQLALALKSRMEEDLSGVAASIGA